MRIMEIKLPKIKITNEELVCFPAGSLEVDPFWYDLYGIETKN
jgi:hypothetical protein